MPVQYAKSYIDQLYASREIFRLHDVVTICQRERELPDQFKLFLRMWEWACASRSGVWQYYEGVTSSDFKDTLRLLKKHDVAAIAEKYEWGMRHWKSPERCETLDNWIFENWSEMEESAFALISDDRAFLYPKGEDR